MKYHRFPHHPSTRRQAWINRVFDREMVDNGGVIQTDIHDVEKQMGLENFIEEVERRGFSLIRTNNRFVVICQSGPLDIWI